MDSLHDFVAKYFPNERITSEQNVILSDPNLEHAQPIAYDAAIFPKSVPLVETPLAYYIDPRPQMLFRYQMQFLFASVLMVPMFALFSAFSIPVSTLCIALALIYVTMYIFYHETKTPLEHPANMIRIFKERIVSKEKSGDALVIVANMRHGDSYELISKLDKFEQEKLARIYGDTFGRQVPLGRAGYDSSLVAVAFKAA